MYQCTMVHVLLCILVLYTLYSDILIFLNGQIVHISAELIQEKVVNGLALITPTGQLVYDWGALSGQAEVTIFNGGICFGYF